MVRPLQSCVVGWAMSLARQNVEVPPRVLALLCVIAERFNHDEGHARPGYELLKADTGWSMDTVVRTLRKAQELGAITIRTGVPADRRGGPGRGRAAEIVFTSTVLTAPDLEVLKKRDREKKTQHACGVSVADKTQQGSGVSSDKTPQTGTENPANRPDKTPQGCGAYLTDSTYEPTSTRARDLAIEFRTWDSTNRQPGELDGQATARFLGLKSIPVPSPLHMEFERALKTSWTATTPWKATA